MQKKLADKLINKCTEIIEEKELAEITPFENKNNSCKVYITLNYCLFNLLQSVFD